MTREEMCKRRWKPYEIIEYKDEGMKHPAECLLSAMQDGYEIIVSPGGFCWMWSIIEKGEVIDSCAYHPNLPTSELDAKVKGERAFNKLQPK